jgi:hypothetical protein
LPAPSRAYNAHPDDSTTVTDQFLPYRHVNATTGAYYIAASDLSKALKVESAKFLIDVLEKCGLGSIKNTEVDPATGDCEIDYQLFVAFLETGTLPGRKPPKKKLSRHHQIINELNGLSASESLPNLHNDVTTLYTTSLPASPSTTPDRKSNARKRGSSRGDDSGLPPLRPASPNDSIFLSDMEKATKFADRTRTLARPEEGIYPGVFRALGYSTLTRCRSLSKFTNKPERKGSGRPLWKKQETVIQERIVKYITVEPDGSIQTLIESQKDMTEVTHMECKDSGEFAHRETTEYEQTETFNDELVMAERGEESYVHMKSKEDEYEHMESHMPRKEREMAKAQMMRDQVQQQLDEERAARAAIREEIMAERAKLAEEGFDPDDQQFGGKFALPRLSLRDEIEMEREILLAQGINPDDPDFGGKYSLPPAHYPDDLLTERRRMMEQGVDPDDPEFLGKYALPDEPDYADEGAPHVGGVYGPGGIDHTPVGPMGMKLGDPPPDGLTEEEQVWWAAQQRALLEEQYMQDMIRANMGMEGGRPDGGETGGEDGDANILFFDEDEDEEGGGCGVRREGGDQQHMYDEEDQYGGDADFAYQQQREQQRKRQAARQEKRRQSREGLSNATNVTPSTRVHVPNPDLKEELFGADDGGEGAPAFAQQRIVPGEVFGEAKDAENVDPRESNANTPEKAALSGSKIAAAQAMEFASPTPSDKAAGLD